MMEGKKLQYLISLFGGMCRYGWCFVSEETAQTAQILTGNGMYAGGGQEDLPQAGLIAIGTFTVN